LEYMKMHGPENIKASKHVSFELWL
jgi:hypothetical protein